MLAECPRCGDLILAGEVGGVRTRVRTATIPPAHAAVLYHYGQISLVADRRSTGLYADAWRPGSHDLTQPRRYLLPVHVCGAPCTRNWGFPP